MTKDEVNLIIPRSNPIDAYAKGGIIARSGLTIEQFRALL